LAIIFAYVNVLLIEAGLFTPLLTPARFFRSNNGAKFHEVIAAGANAIRRRSLSALLPKADMCGASEQVCCGPMVDI
jgi:hypothetical protein